MSQRVLTALPVYNEARHLSTVLAQVRKFAEHILIVDDGSTDDTPTLLAAEPGIEVVTHRPNRGYGAALVTAFEYAAANHYDVLVTIDCDGQHQPCLIPKLAARVFAEPDRPTQMVSGSRYLKSFAGDSAPPVDRQRINAEITQWLNQKFNWPLTDAFCGFKAYHVPSLADLKITVPGYAMPLQLWVQAARLGWRIEEFPVPLIYLDEKRSFGGNLDDAERRRRHYYEVLDEEVRRVESGEFP